MRILLVADEDWVLEDVEAALAESRFEVTTSGDPHGAVETCREIEADVVIVDLQVASMGGMAIIRRIRAAVDAKVLGPTPTILLLDRGADRFIAGRAGADGSLRKPFGSFDLRSMVDDLAAASADA
jgi:DNA-binding response OmpR family regulator